MEEEKALARVSIGEIDYQVRDGNVTTPFRDCYVVTTAGQIWDIRALAFSCDKETIIRLWNNDRKQFRKREFAPSA